MGGDMITVTGCFEVLVLNHVSVTREEEREDEFNQYILELEERGCKSYWRINECNEVVFNEDVDGAYWDDMFEDLQQVCSRLQAIGYELLGSMIAVCLEGRVEMFRMTILADGNPVHPVLQRFEAGFSLIN